MQEEWRDIIITKNGVVYDFTGLYQVSNFGRVRALGGKKYCHKDDMLLKPQTNKGYSHVNLYVNGKMTPFSIHRLVATAFIPNPDNLPVVNHKDYNRQNNCVDNLEWCTYKYNAQYSSSNISKNHANFKGCKNPKAKKVKCIETGEIFGCVKEAEQWCGKKGIGDCCKGKQKTAGGYHWQYVD